MTTSLEEYKQRLEVLSLRDEKRLLRDISFIEKRQKQNQPVDRKLKKLEENFTQALEAMSAKQRALPEITFPEALPVSQKQEDIAELIRENQVVVLAGETGSGKTTQIPKICMRLGRGLRGKIGHTQPRRIAARTVASRIAEELNSELGNIVGYQVRFTDHTVNNTYVKLMTDGILLAEIQRDPLLLDYDTLIIDEAHERSLNIDFLLGYMKEILPKRPDLKLIVTSATIDVEKFSKHFNKAPIIEVSGRTFPVETEYMPWQERFDDQNEAIVDCIDHILVHYPRGDILVFLPGERDIRELSHLIKKNDLKHVDVLPLYARLSLGEQNKIFQPGKGTRVVLATNVAETSITVPGIKYVIDPGLARISRYSVRTKVQRLPIEAISQASANQRKGRCGRVAEGVCFRLYSEEDFNTRPEFTDPEIQRTNLAAVILQMLHMRIGDVRAFSFVDAPDRKLVSDGFKLLEELRAVKVNGEVTPLGKHLSQLPIDPRLAAVVYEANKLGCLHDVLIIVSALSIQDPRERPADKQQASDEKHRRFWDDASDFVAYINLWQYVEEKRQELSQSQFRRLCKKEFLNFLRIREWRDLHRQLSIACKSLEFDVTSEQGGYEAIHRSLVCGYLSQIGNADKESQSREYMGTRNKRFTIFPGSSQFKKKHPWLLAAEFIETSQLFAHGIAKIEPEWVLDYCSHLAKKHYFEPYYDVKAGQVQGFVKTSLLGLVLQEKKRVSYNKVDPKVASDIFIREALVEGKYRGKGTFFKANKALIDEVHQLEDKSRRRDILVDEEVLVAFYREKVPEKVSNLQGFEHWRKQVEQESPKLLFLDKAFLMRHAASHVTEQQFPDHIKIGDYTFGLQYCFDPGKKNDGVSIQIPVEWLHEVAAERLEWLVPGILREKCIALVKALPKATRKNFVPVPEYVDRVLTRLTPQAVSLTESLAEALGHISSVKIERDAWSDVVIDDYYRMNIQVIDENGKVIDQSRDLQKLKSKYRATVKKTLAKVGGEYEKEGIVSWEFSSLPESVQLDRGAVKIKAYPALIPKRECVDLKVLDNLSEAKHNTQLAGLRLIQLALPGLTKDLRQRLLKGKDIGLSVVRLGKREEVVDDLLLAAIKQILDGQTTFANHTEFEAAVEKVKPKLYVEAEKLEAQLLDILAAIVIIKRSVKTHRNPLAIAMAAQDIANQIDALVFPGFLQATPPAWLSQFARYFRAIEFRLEKIGQNTGRDSANTQILSGLWELHEKRLQEEGVWQYEQNENWQLFRWMIEELRVSFFAQTLKTKMPVSEKRLRKQWQDVIDC